MSRNEWEHGTIKLPKAEFARVRQALADKQGADSEAIYAKAQEFWANLTPKAKRDRVAFYRALDEFTEANVKRTFGLFPRDEQTLPAGFRGAVERGQGAGGFKAARVKKSDLVFPTSQTLSFSTAEGDAEITFNRDDSTVDWGVLENNHAVEHGRSDPLAETLFSALASVRWTRATGGVIVGNDEYNQDSREYGGGSNYATSGFGPVGAAEAPQCTLPYRMADGTLVTSSGFDRVAKAAARAAGQQGRRVAGSAGGAGGQFTDKYHSSPEVSLTPF